MWDKYGFEKMQSFSGAMAQLNFWRQWIPDTQIKDMAFCKGKQLLQFIVYWSPLKEELSFLEKVRPFVNVKTIIRAA